MKEHQVRIRGDNTAKVIEQLRFERITTVSDLVSGTGLSRGTIRKILERLEPHDVVAKDGKQAASIDGGKPPNLFRFNPRARFAIGMHLSFHFLYAKLVDPDALTVGELKYPIAYNIEIDTLLTLVQTAVRELLTEHGIDEDRIAGMALGGHGATDYERGVVVTSPHNPLWGKDVRLRDLIAEAPHHRFPVFVDNAIRFRTYADRWLGRLKDVKDAVVIHCSEGIIAGVMLDEVVRRGPSNLAGSIGHLKLNPLDSTQCMCGGYGCFEMQVVPDRLQQKANALRQEFPNSTLPDHSYQNFEAEELFAAADAGDELAKMVVDEAAYWFAVACRNLTLTIDPDIIVLQGTYATAGTYFHEQLESKYRTMSLVDAPFRARIAHSELGEEAASDGAALYVISKVLQ